MYYYAIFNCFKYYFRGLNWQIIFFIENFQFRNNIVFNAVLPPLV